MLDFLPHEFYRKKKRERIREREREEQQKQTKREYGSQGVGGKSSEKKMRNEIPTDI